MDLKHVDLDPLDSVICHGGFDYCHFHTTPLLCDLLVLNLKVTGLKQERQLKGQIHEIVLLIPNDWYRMKELIWMFDKDYVTRKNCRKYEEHCETYVTTHCKAFVN